MRKERIGYGEDKRERKNEERDKESERICIVRYLKIVNLY